LSVPSDFAEFFAAHHGPVTSALSAVTGDVDRASDATNEAFVRAAARWERVRRMKNPVGWTYRVAQNDLRRAGRRRTREREITEREQPLTMHHDVVPDLDLWRAVKRLPDRQREAIALRYVLGFTQHEVAEAMGIADGTAAATLTDARSALRRLLDEVPHV
jgi:RNA polymerase sigma factor (sigma-70 family)